MSAISVPATPSILHFIHKEGEYSLASQIKSTMLAACINESIQTKFSKAYATAYCKQISAMRGHGPTGLCKGRITIDASERVWVLLYAPQSSHSDTLTVVASMQFEQKNGRIVSGECLTNSLTT